MIQGREASPIPLGYPSQWPKIGDVCTPHLRVAYALATNPFGPGDDTHKSVGSEDGAFLANIGMNVLSRFNHQ